MIKAQINKNVEHKILIIFLRLNKKYVCFGSDLYKIGQWFRVTGLKILGRVGGTHIFLISFSGIYSF